MTALWWVAPGALLWLAVLLAPWRPWGTRERLEPAVPPPAPDLGGVCVLIPARNEAASLPRCLESLSRQGAGLKVIVVDDQSDDGTAAVARRAGAEVVAGTAVPPGWTGKLWALEQGRARADRPFTVLLDADIALAPGMLAALLLRMHERDAALVSVMATLPMRGLHEKLLIPAFVFFFKLLYPFALANRPGAPVAAAAGGCVLLRTSALEAIGGFGAVRGALIDDCALARAVKRAGHGTWIGLSRGARGLRGYAGLAGIWHMVARTAYTQLGCSPAWLLACTAAMAAAFVAPVAGLLWGNGPVAALAGGAWLAMGTAYLPVLRFYERSPAWALALPLIGTLYLLMTWDSARRDWAGRRSAWRGRVYGRDPVHGRLRVQGERP